MRKKLLLINPANPAHTSYVNQEHIRFLTRKSGGWLNASLPTLAALAPPAFDVRIVDESAEPVPFDAGWDLVGVSLKPTLQERGKEIMRRFRELGVLVVAGGPSVTVSPERWESCADVLVIGEAERVWPKFLQDYLAGRHQAEYREVGRVDLALSPVPDYSGMPMAAIQKFTGGVVQASRGCPFRCEYCDGLVYLGKKMRYKPIERVMEELEQVYRLGKRNVWIADDDFSANPKRSKEIFRRVRDWNREKRVPMGLVTSVSVSIADDEEFLELAAEAGVVRFIIGLETCNEESLREVRKFQNIRPDIEGDIRRIHEHGILVCGGCMVGFDHDDISIFRRQFEFFTRVAIPNVQVYALQAMDGTPVKARMLEQGRYIDPHRDSVGPACETFTIIPKQMTIDQLRQGIYWLLASFYRWEAFEQRLMTYLDNFENSPKKNKLHIPSGPPEAEDVGIAARILKYVLTGADREERRVFYRLVRAALRSSHPQALRVTVGSYLLAKNIVETIKVSNPNFMATPYPEAG